MHRNWLDLTIEGHAETVAAGKQVTGFSIEAGTVPRTRQRQHGGGAVFLNAHPELHKMPPPRARKYRHSLGHDRYHDRTFLAHALPSTLICSKWNQAGITRKILNDKAKHSVWLHGYKDDCFRTLAR